MPDVSADAKHAHHLDIGHWALDIGYFLRASGFGQLPAHTAAVVGPGTFQKTVPSFEGGGYKGS